MDLTHYDEHAVTNEVYGDGPNKGMNYSLVTEGIDLSDFYPSVEFDIMATPAKRHEQYFSCCNAPYVDITYEVL